MKLACDSLYYLRKSAELKKSTRLANINFAKCESRFSTLRARLTKKYAALHVFQSSQQFSARHMFSGNRDVWNAPSHFAKYQQLEIA
jgi:hypothetical protein